MPTLNPFKLYRKYKKRRRISTDNVLRPDQTMHARHGINPMVDETPPFPYGDKRLEEDHPLILRNRLGALAQSKRPLPPIPVEVKPPVLIHSDLPPYIPERDTSFKPPTPQRTESSRMAVKRWTKTQPGSRIPISPIGKGATRDSYEEGQIDPELLRKMTHYSSSIAEPSMEGQSLHDFESFSDISLTDRRPVKRVRFTEPVIHEFDDPIIHGPITHL